MQVEAPPERRGLANLLRWTLTSGLFWGLVAAALVLGGVYLHFRIRITSVPATEQGGRLVIHGSGFGDEQGQGYVLYRQARRPLDVFEQVVDWTNDRVTVQLPEHLDTGGYVQVIQTTPLWEWPSNAFPFVVRAPELPSAPYGYDVPTAPDSPWPSFRRDRRNTASSPLPARYHGDRPWAFRTGKGIFSTPVIDGQGRVYFGSADHYFYVLNPDGSLHWRFKTGELIDSAAVLHRAAPDTGTPPAVTFGSGDGILYHLRTDDAVQDPRDRVLWTFDASATERAGYNDWFEGNVQVGFDGTIYAGNTNWNYYALHPDGTLKWRFPTSNNNWSIPAIADDGTLYWGSCDTRVYAVGADGEKRWSKRTLGFVASSAAIGNDGTVYIGSFDSHLYAFAPDSPWPRWKFKTQDHVYASPALGENAEGETGAIYFGSTDGHCYALNPNGTLRWKYYAGAPIRSSPALGAAPDGTPGAIVYFGCGDGRLYALNTEDGTRRWSFDTTRLHRELRDRNDLNSSPALGETGVYIGGEHGYLYYIPYDYCLEADDTGVWGWFDALRCDTCPAEPWPADETTLRYVSPGGNTRQAFPETLPAATVLTLRLMVRRAGETVPARMDPATITVDAEPPFAFQVEVSAGGDYLYIVPDTFLEPDTDYRLTVAGSYRTNAWHIGNLQFGGEPAGAFTEAFAFTVPPRTTPRIPLEVTPDYTDALAFTRLSVPIPTMMPSLNQIGFDFIKMILGTVAVDPPGEDGRGGVVLWAIGGRHDEDGQLVPNVATGANTESDFSFAYSGEFLGDAFILDSRDLTLGVTGIEIPLQHLGLRGRLMDDLRVRADAAIHGHTPALRVPTYGPLLIMAGLVNNIWQRLLVNGTYVTRPYHGRGPANLRPEGVRVRQMDFRRPTLDTPGYVIASFELAPETPYPVNRHRAAIVLLHADRAQAVHLDYNRNLRTAHDGRGNLSTVTLHLPRGLDLPDPLRAVIMLDVYPAHSVVLTGGEEGEAG